MWGMLNKKDDQLSHDKLSLLLLQTDKIPNLVGEFKQTEVIRFYSKAGDLALRRRRAAFI